MKGKTRSSKTFVLTDRKILSLIHATGDVSVRKKKRKCRKCRVKL